MVTGFVADYASELEIILIFSGLSMESGQIQESQESVSRYCS